jgi:predicted DNA-binding protein (MmcQ/YjbR family)
VRLCRGARPQPEVEVAAEFPTLLCISPAMRLPALRQFALSLQQTTVVNQWGGLVFKVAGKVFFMISLDAETIEGVIFKCTPAEFDELTDIDGIAQAPYFAKRHWVRVADLDALPRSELERRIRRSYDLVVANLPKKVQAELASKLER